MEEMKEMSYSLNLSKVICCTETYKNYLGHQINTTNKVSIDDDSLNWKSSYLVLFVNFYNKIEYGCHV